MNTWFKVAEKSTGKTMICERRRYWDKYSYSMSTNYEKMFPTKKQAYEYAKETGTIRYTN
jgi:hypothetical protein